MFGERRRIMKKRDSDWYIPSEALGLLSTLLLVPCIAVLIGILLPVVAGLKTADVVALYGMGVGAGVVGAALLFIARVPLYRQRRFWTFGPRYLDRKHRRIYWLAYAFVSAGLLLLWVVWLRTR
jgi:hypothetical protein